MIQIENYIDTETQKTFSFIKISSKEALQLYLDIEQDKIKDDEENMVNHPKPSHLSPVSSIAHTAAVRMSMTVNIDEAQRKTNDFFKKLTSAFIQDTSNLYKQMLLESIERQGFVRINSVGGIYAADTVEDFRTKLVSVDTLTEEDLKTKNLFLNPKSEFIILENDPTLDSWFKSNIPEGTSFSYILNLRNTIKNNQLKDYLKQYFYKNNGENKKKVFIYTTGSDVQQMYDYMDIIDDFWGVQVEIIFTEPHSEFRDNHLKFVSKYENGNYLTLKTNL